MGLYVNRITLEVNGVSFSDFESFTDNSVTIAKQVNLMNKTGHALMKERYGFTVNVKVANIDPAVDLFKVRAGTCTVEYEGGKRTTYGGVYTLETGDGTIDGETELTHTVIFGAESKVEE